MNVKLKCAECGRNFKLSNDLLSADVIEEENDEVLVTYCRCPKCGADKPVQVDDQSTKDIIKRMERVAAGNPGKKQSALIKKLDQKLNERRKRIATKYDIDLYDFDMILGGEGQ